MPDLHFVETSNDGMVYVGETRHWPGGAQRTGINSWEPPIPVLHGRNRLRISATAIIAEYRMTDLTLISFLGGLGADEIE